MSIKRGKKKLARIIVRILILRISYLKFKKTKKYT